MENEEKYYKEALTWYSDIYNMPNSERVALIIITSFAVVVFSFMVYATYMFLPLIPSAPYRINSADALGEIPSIVRLTKGTQKNLAITRFIAKKYTEARENYDVRKIERNFNMVKQFSSQEVLDKYVQYMKISNPDSPLLKYERHTTRKIFIESSIVHKTENWLNNKAIIDFQAIETRRGKEKIEEMQAVITFNFDKIVVNQKTGEMSPLKLEILNYSVKRR